MQENTSLRTDSLVGTEQFNELQKQALDKLIRLAINQKTTTYREFAESLGLPTQGNALGAAITPVLTAIARWCIERSMPPLTVLVVRSSGPEKSLPGKGFWLEYGYPENITLHERRTLTQGFTNDVYLFFSAYAEKQYTGRRVSQSDWKISDLGNGELEAYNNELNQRVILSVTGVKVFSTKWREHFAKGMRVVQNTGGAVMEVVDVVIVANEVQTVLVADPMDPDNKTIEFRPEDLTIIKRHKRQPKRNECKLITTSIAVDRRGPIVPESEA